MQIGPSNSLLRALSSVLQPQQASGTSGAAAAAPVRAAAPAAQVAARAAPPVNMAQAQIPTTQPANPLPRGSLINIRV